LSKFKFGILPAMRHKLQTVTGALKHSRVVRVTQTRCSYCDLLENSLEIGGRV